MDPGRLDMVPVRADMVPVRAGVDNCLMKNGLGQPPRLPGRMVRTSS